MNFTVYCLIIKSGVAALSVLTAFYIADVDEIVPIEPADLIIIRIFVNHAFFIT